MKKLSLILLILISSYGIIRAQESSLVYPGTDGKLVYTPHAFHKETDSVHIIPDFSHAGYKGGGVALPVGQVPVKVTLNPQASGEDRTRIQAAIDSVSAMPLDANGFRGAVLLKAGTYRVNDGNIPGGNDGAESALTINTDGVVLRGEGQGVDGTILYSSHKQRHTLINIKRDGSKKIPLDTVAVTSNYVGSGQSTFDVADASGYVVGDTIEVLFTPNNQWINDIKVNNYISSPSDYWDKADFWFGSDYKIEAINGNSITVDCPLVQPLQARYGGGHISKVTYQNRISNVGIEDLRIVGIDETIQGPTDDDRLKYGIRVWKVSDCWVHGVSVVHSSEGAVSMGHSVNITAEEIAYLEPLGPISGGWRYPFKLSGNSNRCLFQRCYAEEARHDVVSVNRVPGPNVFLDVVSENGYSPLGPHARWATGTLYDNIKSDSKMNLNEFNMNDGHAWCGAQTVGWNLECRSYVNDAPEGSMNYLIGSIGDEHNGGKNNSNNGVHRSFWESHGTHVATRSLYLKQMDDRLGAAAVADVTHPKQLTGNIYNLLSQWAGEGALPVEEAPANFAVASGILTWTDLASDETGYVVERSADKGVTFTQLALLAPDTEQYTETEELIGIYVYRVKSVHSSGSSTYTKAIRTLFTGNNPVTYSPDHDAYVRGGVNENTNYGSETDINVKKGSNTDNYRKGMVQFDLSQEGLGSSIILQATLRLYVSDVDGKVPVTAKDMADNWDESTIIFSNAPGGNDILDEVEVDDSSVGQYILLDVTDYVQTELSGDGVVSIHLYDWARTNNMATFNSKEAASNHPELVISTATVQTQDYTYNPTEDSYIRGDIYGDDNYGSDAILAVRKGNADKNKRKSFVKFDLSNEGLSNVTNATLRLYASLVDANVTLSACDLDDNWSESTITWNNAQDMPTVINTTSLSSANVYYEFDVTTFAQAQLAGDGVISIGIMDKTTSNIDIEFNSKESSTNKPELVITGTKAANKYGKVTDINPTQENQPAVLVYPNPAKGYVNIQFADSNELPVTVVLYDSNGQMLLQKRFHANTEDFKLDLTGVNPGLHLLKVIYDDNTIVKKMSVK